MLMKFETPCVVSNHFSWQEQDDPYLSVMQITQVKLGKGGDL